MLAVMVERKEIYVCVCLVLRVCAFKCKCVCVCALYMLCVLRVCVCFVFTHVYVRQGFARLRDFQNSAFFRDLNIGEGQYTHVSF